MALFQISNDKITIQVDSMGAELKSLKDVATGREYMWHADPQYWKRTSPVLFPIVGSLNNGSYQYDGKEYVLEFIEGVDLQGYLYRWVHTPEILISKVKRI